MAKYFGVSSDTLRLYDRKGILSPHKEENGYRVYSREDMIFLDYVIRLRRLGLPLKDIKALVHKGSMLDAERVLCTQSDRLLRRMEELNALYIATQDYRLALVETWNELGDIQVCESPRMILRLIDDSFISAVSAFEKLGNGLVPRFCTLTSPETVWDDGYETNMYDYDIRNNALRNAVVVIDRDNKIRVPKKHSDEFTVFEPRKCVRMAAMCHSQTDYEAYIRLRRYIIEHGYHAVDDMISVFIAVRCGAKNDDDYYQVYIPIE